MKPSRICVDENGRLMHPTTREPRGVSPGDEFTLSVDDDELLLSTLKSRIARAQLYARQHAIPGKSVVDEFLAERRATDY